MRNREEFTDVMQRYSDTVWRVCAIYLHQKADIEDAFQDTFVKYAKADMEFSSEEHRKAWFITVATNTCKDLLKSSSHKTVLMDTFDEGQIPMNAAQNDANDMNAPNDGPDVIEALRALDEKYRLALYLTYYEGYSAAEIAKLFNMPVNTVYTNLARGRKQLKEVLEDDGT